MIIDESARNFFSDLNVLQQIDYLHEALDAFKDDIATRRLDWLEKELSDFATKNAAHWALRVSRSADPRYIALQWRGGTKWPSDLHVEFGWNSKHESGKMPGDPWIGIRVSRATIQTRVSRTVGHLFSSDLVKEADYGIYEYIKDWPRLKACKWVEVYSLIESEGKPFLSPRVSQIEHIAQSLASEMTRRAQHPREG